MISADELIEKVKAHILNMSKEEFIAFADKCGIALEEVESNEDKKNLSSRKLSRNAQTNLIATASRLKRVYN